MRRVLLVLLLIAIGGAAAWTVLRWNPAGNNRLDPWSAIPDQAALIIEIPDPWRTWDRFAHSSLLWRTWETQPGAAAMGRTIAQIHEKGEADPALKQAVGNEPVLAALVRTGAGEAHALFVGSLAANSEASTIAKVFPLDAAQLQSLGDGAVVPIALDGGANHASIAIRDGLWLLSSSSDLVQEALLQVERGTPLTSDPAFAKARTTLGGGTDAHVLVHGVRGKGLLNAWWMPERLERLAVPDGWAALDVRIQPDAILLSGLLIGADNGEVSKLVAQQGNGPWNIARALPAGVSRWSVWNVSGATVLNAPADEALCPWAHGMVASASAFGNGNAQHWLVMETDDPDRATEELTARSGADTLTYRGNRMARLAQATGWEKLMGQYEDLPQQPWWTILGRAVLLSDDMGALQASIDAWNDGNGLAEQRRTTAWFDRQSEDAAFTWWADPTRAQAYFRNGLRPNADSAFTELAPLWSAHAGICVQLSAAANNMVHVGIALQHATGQTVPGQQAEGNVLWTADLGAPVLRKPDLLINHTTGTREVLVQDTLHRIHLISSTGKILWSRALDGPIMGGVHQVDRFQNGKLQMLFNTEATGYLIDRNGKDVGSPFKIPSTAVAPLSVFDYDEQREYRILIPAADGRIHNLTLDWTGVEGWAMPKLATAAIASIHHLRIRNKDFLLAIDGDGAMKLFDRKGQERETVTAKLARVKEVHAVIAGADIMATRIQWTDQDLARQETSLAGEGGPIVPQEGDSTALRQAAPYVIGDINLDGAPERVTVEGNKVTVVVAPKEQ